MNMKEKEAISELYSRRAEAPVCGILSVHIDASNNFTCHPPYCSFTTTYGVNV